MVLNGWGVGETHHGGFSQRARVKAEWLVKLPDEISNAQAMAIGTAGYTAMLSVIALERHGVTPDKGEVLVTGAAGGVGSIAVALLAGLGYTVAASTGRPQEGDYLKFLGASKIVDRNELSAAGKALQAERWIGAVDTVGSHTLANVCAQTKWNGAVAACGLAQGADFPSTVMPFILRGIALYGINSIFVPNDIRARAWQLIAQHVDRAKLEQMTVEIGLSEAIAYAPSVLDGKVRGRTVVDVNR